MNLEKKKRVTKTLGFILWGEWSRKPFYLAIGFGQTLSWTRVFAGSIRGKVIGGPFEFSGDYLAIWTLVPRYYTFIFFTILTRHNSPLKRLSRAYVWFKAFYLEILWDVLLCLEIEKPGEIFILLSPMISWSVCPHGRPEAARQQSSWKDFHSGPLDVCWWKSRGPHLSLLAASW